MSKTLYLIDISSFIFRAFYAIRNLKSHSGEPTNAVFGVASMLARLSEEAKPEYCCVVYDSKEPSFRKEIYKDYKAHRPPPPEDLIPQFDRIDEMVSAFGIPSIRQSGMEADDLIGTLAMKWSRRSVEHEVVIVSSDKDLMQLIYDRITLWDTLSGKRYRDTEVKEKFGVLPSQIRDYLAIVGDSSDNIPGVEGIGAKGAVDLLNEYQSLEGILEAAKAGKITGKKGAAILSGEKDALLSQKLATVVQDLEIEIHEEKLRFVFGITPEIRRLFNELDFQSLIRKWEASSTVHQTPEPTQLSVDMPGQPPEDTFRCIDTEKALRDCFNQIARMPEVAIDLETTSLNPRQARIVGISLAYDEGFGLYLPISHREGKKQLSLQSVLEPFGRLMEDSRQKKIGQNIKYDLSVLREAGIRPDGIGADTMVADYVLDAEGRHDLGTLARKHLAYSVLTYEEVCGKGKDEIKFDQVSIEKATRYSAEDAWITLKLWNQLKRKLEEDKLMRVFACVDQPLVMILMEMERSGIGVDLKRLEELQKQFGHEIAILEKKIHAQTREDLNLNSPKQLAKLLFEDLKLPVQTKTKTGYSTDASVLEKLAPLHEIPRLLLEYRELSKLKGTYLDPLPEMIDEKTGRVHASFHQTVTATGRLSSSEPNLQNIPIRSRQGRLLRSIFVPREGCVLLSADYSQVELRILAHMSQDDDLMEAFRLGEDVHRRTAGELFHCKPADVTGEQRSVAKAINFGLMYGKTIFGLSQELSIPRKQAQEFIEKYFARYPKVKRFLDAQIGLAREKGETHTLSGRRRKLPEIHSSNHVIRSNAERMAMNTPIQGTAADLIKLAMIRLHETLQKHSMQSQLIVQVHDELLLECPRSEVEKVTGMVRESMEQAMDLSVPLIVNISTGSNWMEL